MKISTLDGWFTKQLENPASPVSRANIQNYQITKLQEVICYAKNKSRYYKNHLAGCQGCFTSLQQVVDIPLTHSSQLALHGIDFVCVRQDDIHRLVTIPTSGTTGAEKRVGFTSEDLNRIIAFFEVGMSNLVKAGDRVLILFPSTRPGSVGDLLAMALEQIGCVPFKANLPFSEPDILYFICRNGINSLVGAPIQLNRIARYDEYYRILPERQIKTVLASSDYLPASMRKVIEHIWLCEIFDHYAMTETGYGSGVECGSHHGYHLRETEYIFEIIDPARKVPLLDGEWGEVVVTSLTHQAMPFIRYQTGDISRFLPENCECGSNVKRLDRIQGRIGVGIALGDRLLQQSELDDALFPVPGLMNFHASLEGNAKESVLILNVQFPEVGLYDQNVILEALQSISAIVDLNNRQFLTIQVILSPNGFDQQQNSMIKRKIQDNRTWQSIS